MKIRKRALSAVTVFGLAAIAIVAIGSNDAIISSDAESQSYTMTFSNTHNKITKTELGYEELNFTTDLGNEVLIGVEDITALNGGWGTMSSLGALHFKDPLIGVNSIEITVDNPVDEFEVLHNYYNNGSDYTVFDLTDDVYSVHFSDPQNYLEIWRLSNVDDAINISSIKITYSCSFDGAARAPFLKARYNRFSRPSGTRETILGSNTDWYYAQDYLLNDLRDQVTVTIISGQGTLDGNDFIFGPAGDVTEAELNLTDSDGRQADPIRLYFTAT